MRQKPYSPAFMAALGQVLPPGVQATGKPGELFIEGVGVRKFADMRQDVLYDRVTFTREAGDLPKGSRFVFFRDIQNKTRLETNMSQSGRLPTDQEAVVYRINLLPLPETDPDDMKLLMSYMYGEMVLDEDNKVRSGPALIFPSAHGLYGGIQTTKTDETVGNLSNGVPSTGANPRLMLPIFLGDGRTFRYDVVFYEAVTLSADPICYVILDCLIARPLR